jgi:ABC-type lipoprotein export system ATPase subunit
MSNVFDEITYWASQNLPFWEQAALDKIIAGDPITDEILDVLLDFLLEDAGLKMIILQRPNLIHLTSQVPHSLNSNPKVTLKKIYNLKNINALVPNQFLEFGPSLTLIFGANGSGKSGYARVIGNAAFTRGDKQILPDITKTHPSQEPLTADIDLGVDGNSVTIHYTVGEICSQLRSFYVFDSTSVKSHLTKENPMSFSPAGLEVLTNLATTTDEIRKRLEERCNQKESSGNIFDPFFIGNSKVKSYISTLGAETDVQALEKLARITDDEKKHIDELELRIAELRNEKITEQINQIDQEIDDLEVLIESLDQISGTLSDGAANEINDLINGWVRNHLLTQETGIESFKSEHFTQIGAEVWGQFIQAAYALGQAETSSYPVDGDHCLLCHQPLSVEAKNLINRTWQYLKSQVQENLDQIQTVLSAKLDILDHLDFSIINDQTVSYRYLKSNNPAVLTSIQAYLQICKERKDALDSAIIGHQSYELGHLPESPNGSISEINGKLLKDKLELENKKVEEEIQVFEKEKLELEHRLLLSQQLNLIEDFIERARWVKQARTPQVKRSTQHITRKYNELFEQLVTQEYIKLFEQTLVKIKCPLRMKVATRGSKGETRKHITLLREDNETIADVPPDKVLSEGEQRAVALADFLTEVALDENSSGILLDDPVSSLDFQWKETIAHHIVEEAKRQQVIVFTHDLHFLSCIKIYAEDAQVDLLSHWIEKRDDHPGWVSLGNSPCSEKEYKNANKARQFYSQILNSNLKAEERQIGLQQGFGALRTCYEAFIMFDLFGEVVIRFQERISPDRLKRVYIDELTKEEVISNYGRISQLIEGHLHSDANAAQKPTPELLLQEIEIFEELKRKHKAAKKAHGIND